MAVDRLAFERQLWHAGQRHIAGVDEAGRGPLAGPVVAAAVVVPRDWIERRWPEALAGLNDSKQLSATERECFFRELTGCAEVRYGIAAVEADQIDQLNILRATHRAMCEAVALLTPPADHALVDGLPVPALPCPHTALVKGDARSYAIAAASVLAKVTRDRRMLEADRLFPAYGFARHKGYPTREHLAAIARHGPCPLHRRSFAPLRTAGPELW